MTERQLATRQRLGDSAPRIEVRGVGKQYGASTVLQDIDLTISPGEIHGLIGENGAGKSTLLRILGGATTADMGSLLLDGEQVKISSPRDSIKNGILLIAQELALIPARTVLENVFLGRWANSAGLVRRSRDRARFNELVAETGFDLDPDAIVGGLAIGQAQQVEILKALACGARILCLDEPTAVLNEAEKENLLRVIQGLAAAGTTVILVSHYLEEVLAIADRITILRDGRLIATEEAALHTPESLVRHMVGRDIDILLPDFADVEADAEVVIAVSGLSNNRLTDISLEVRRGEILGIAGLVGSGRSEVLMAIFGGDRRSSGTVVVNGRDVPPNSIAQAIRAGIALVPESRKEQGLVMNRPVRENIALATLRARSVLGFVRVRREKKRVTEISHAVDLRGDWDSPSIARLSGGNQQKALFAKWLLDPPAVLLIDEPTRGVDIAAKSRIHGMILELASNGTAVVLVSSELEEVIGLSHRVMVMRHGRLVAKFDRNASRNEVMSSAFLS